MSSLHNVWMAVYHDTPLNMPILFCCSFEDKRVIIRQGHMADNFYFILSGTGTHSFYQLMSTPLILTNACGILVIRNQCSYFWSRKKPLIFRNVHIAYTKWKSFLKIKTFILIFLNFEALNQEKNYFKNIILQALLFILDIFTHFLKLLKNQCMWYGGNKELVFLLLN